MKISAKIDYACKALLELSVHWPNKEPLNIETIGKNQNIPTNFLIQILLNLKQHGYVQSIRGKHGGYILSCHPIKIKLKDIISIFDPSSFTNHGSYKKNSADTIANVWREIDKVTLSAVEKIDFEVIRNRKLSNDSVMMFEI